MRRQWMPTVYPRSRLRRAATEPPPAPRSPPAPPREDDVILQLPAGVGLAVISGLADDVRISPADDGTSVAMSWKRRSASA